MKLPYSTSGSRASILIALPPARRQRPGRSTPSGCSSTEGTGTSTSPKSSRAARPVCASTTPFRPSATNSWSTIPAASSSAIVTPRRRRGCSPPWWSSCLHSTPAASCASASASARFAATSPRRSRRKSLAPLSAPGCCSGWRRDSSPVRPPACRPSCSNPPRRCCLLPCRRIRRRPLPVTSDLVVDLLTALCHLGVHSLGEQTVEHLVNGPEPFSVDAILVPAACLLAEHDSPASDRLPTWRLRAHCLDHLARRINQPLAPPVDFARPSRVGCSCAHYRELSEFLADPVRSVWVLRAAQRYHRHVFKVGGRCSGDEGNAERFHHPDASKASATPGMPALTRSFRGGRSGCPCTSSGRRRR